MKILILIVGLFCGGCEVSSREVTGADFLKLIVSGRVAALGGSVIGLSDNLSSLYYHPAGLGSLRKDGIFLMYSEAVESESGYQAINYCKKLKGAACGVGLLYYKNDYPITELREDKPWEKIGEGKYQDLAIIWGYADELLRDLFWGVGIKYIDRHIEGRNFSRNGRVFALDFGLLFIGRNLSVGVNMQNIGPKIYFVNKEESDDLPRYINAGICYKLANIKFLFDIKHMLLEHSKLEYSSGIELGLAKKVLVLRAGYAKREGNIEGLSYGVGINLQWPISVSVDFADIPSGQLNRLKQISLNIDL